MLSEILRPSRIFNKYIWYLSTKRCEKENVYTQVHNRHFVHRCTCRCKRVSISHTLYYRNNKRLRMKMGMEEESKISCSRVDSYLLVPIRYTLGTACWQIYWVFYINSFLAYVHFLSCLRSAYSDRDRACSVFTRNRETFPHLKRMAAMQDPTLPIYY